MTRLQKKCMVFSLGLHGLLAVILLVSSGFGNRPQQTDLQILTMIPANIVDRAGAGGGTKVVNLTPRPQAQAASRPVAPPQPHPQPPAPQVEQARQEPVRPTRHVRQEETHERPTPDDAHSLSLERRPKISKWHPNHDIQINDSSIRRVKTARRRETTSYAESSERAEAQRLREVENSLGQLASGVRESGSPNTIVDTEGIGGGAAFAGYRDIIFNYYYHAWMTPDDAASRRSSVNARITVARDGRILDAELISPSDDPVLDRSVERTLREVVKLPPFPSSARDEQRTFVIRFSLEAKEMSG